MTDRQLIALLVGVAGVIAALLVYFVVPHMAGPTAELSGEVVR